MQFSLNIHQWPYKLKIAALRDHEVAWNVPSERCGKAFCFDRPADYSEDFSNTSHSRQCLATLTQAQTLHLRDAFEECETISISTAKNKIKSQNTKTQVSSDYFCWNLFSFHPPSFSFLNNLSFVSEGAAAALHSLAIHTRRDHASFFRLAGLCVRVHTRPHANQLTRKYPSLQI